MAKRAGIKGTEDLDNGEPEAEAEAPAAAPADDPSNPSQLQPYPHGSPKDPEDEFEAMHGFRRAPAKEK